MFIIFNSGKKTRKEENPIICSLYLIMIKKRTRKKNQWYVYYI